MIEKIKRELDEKFEAREKALKASRDIVPTCARAIRLVQKREFKKAEQEAERIRQKISAVEKLLEGYPVLRNSVLSSAWQEYSELVIYLSVAEGKELPEPDVPPEYYLTGLGDAIGELKRYALELMAEGKKEDAKRLYEELEDFYSEYAGLAYPNSIVPGLKHKQDVARKVLNDLRETLAKARIFSG